MRKLEDFTEGMKVVYVPEHAEGNTGHKDAEVGVVVDVNKASSLVFVRFGDNAHAHTCRPETLHVPSGEKPAEAKAAAKDAGGPGAVAGGAPGAVQGGPAANKP